ncbi:MAG TPA: hypothetical protein VMT81_00975 [Candidatus Paceibacterota bacterium]|nr:hypothetical protein [Candidatus Paceibacterota bacterium]
MPLPQQVINQLGHEPPATPGWSLGILSFAGGIFLAVLAIYFGIAFAYEPYLNGKLAGLESQVSQASQSFSSGDQAQLVSFYSQVVNLQSLLKGRSMLTSFFQWLENNTQANTYYSQITVTPGGQVSLSVASKSDADLNQQIAIFEASPQVDGLSISSVGLNAATGLWQFTATLDMDPGVFNSPLSS